MKRLYKKSELAFAIIWIVFYVLVFSVADMLSAYLGYEKIITAPISVAVSLFLFLWIWKNGLTDKYGLKRAKFPFKVYLCFIPLIVMISVNLWGGIRFQYGVLETVLFVVSMLGVGVIEELIFRGFLFKAMSKDSVTWAIIVSSLTFGLGHVINLINGAEVIPTLLQIVYAIAGGFLFTVIFYKSGCLLPCIIAHGLINALSVFAVDFTFKFHIITAVCLKIISLGYALWILWKSSSGNKEDKRS